MTDYRYSTYRYSASEYHWGGVVGCRPDNEEKELREMSFSCDLCGKTEYWGDYDELVSIHRDDDEKNYCRLCMNDRYAVNDIILAFFPEMAEFINARGSLAASARSIELDFGELRGLVVIQAWKDFQKTLIPDQRTDVRIAAFTGTMDKSNAEIIKFKVHFGSVSLCVEDNIARLNDDYTARFDPQNIVDHLKFDSRTKWINMNSWEKRSYYPIEYRYNVFDNVGLDLVFEWARAIAVNWIMCVDPVLPEFKHRS